MQEPRIPGGYILLSRKIIESEIWNKPPLYLKVWVYILSKAQHKDFNNLERGQAFVSIPELIEVCSYKVGYRTEKPTKKQIYGILEWLRNPNERDNEGECESTMIETTKVTHGMLVKVSNYAYYQDPKNYEGNNEGTTKDNTKEQRKESKGNNKYKNDKNDKNVKKNKYADFVSMTSEQYQKLVDQFGEDGTKDRIENLNLYKGSSGKKYKDDYLTILSWERKNQKTKKKSKEINWEDL